MLKQDRRERKKVAQKKENQEMDTRQKQFGGAIAFALGTQKVSFKLFFITQCYVTISDQMKRKKNNQENDSGWKIMLMMKVFSNSDVLRTLHCFSAIRSSKDLFTATKKC
jgi:hypothetical protein